MVEAHTGTDPRIPMTSTSDPALRDGAEAVATATDRLREAARSGTPCAPVRDLVGETDIATAYVIQQALVDERVAAGAVVTGRKIGLTSPAVQAQLGVDQPDFGVLFDDMDVSALPEVPSERLLQPKAEAEIAFVLRDDLAEDALDRADLDLAAVRDAVDHAVAALEIVDSRVAAWDIRITDTVADNASSGLYVLGDRRVPIADLEPVEVTMQMYVDDELVSEGDGSACLGDPLNALLWLARTAHEFGTPLRPGQVVLSGALGPMVPAPPGTSVRAELSTLGTVTAAFSTPTKDQ